MYYVSKRIEVAGAHQLQLPYESKCTNIHGHNWIITVYCKAAKLTDYGMVVDFKKIKNVIHNKLDHQYFNEVISNINPTAENIAHWILDRVNEVCDNPYAYCYKVSVQESEGNIAWYEEEENESR